MNYARTAQNLWQSAGNLSVCGELRLLLLLDGCLIEGPDRAPSGWSPVQGLGNSQVPAHARGRPFAKRRPISTL